MSVSDLSINLLQVVNSLFQTCQLTTWDKQCEDNLLTDLLQDVCYFEGFNINRYISTVYT
jgi:hypothetical protein